MPAGHRHATDRTDIQAVAECPNGCQEWIIEVGSSLPSFDDLFPDAVLTCATCHSEMTHLVYEEPSEVLD